MVDNLYSAIGARAEVSPNAVALETERGETFTYSAFDEWTARMSNWLTTQGVRAGDRVLVQADKSAYLLMLCYATIRAGGVFVPINAGARREEVSRVVADCAPAVVVSDPRRQRLYESLRSAESAAFHIATLSPQGNGSAIEQARQQPSRNFIAAVSSDAPAALMYTSGTTGQPKAAIITHRNILSNGTALRDFWHWSSQEVLLHTLPLYHLHGLFVATMPSLLSGSKILLYRRFVPRQAIEALPRTSVFMGVPTYFHRLLASHVLSREQCARVRLFISGSAPLSEQTFQAFRARTGHEILCRYGLTETGGVACNPPGTPRLLGAAGVPLPGFAVRIGDESSSEAPVGQIGEVQVRGDSVFPGYWRRPLETSMAFTTDGYFRTGDLGRRMEDSSLDIVGRAKDVIITGGANVNPLEVEAAIDACPGVAESAVVGVPHPEFGEVVVAFVVPLQKAQGGTDNSNILNGLLTRLKRELALYKVPRRMLMRTGLPRNAMGKVQKNLLRDDPELLAETAGEKPM